MNISVIVPTYNGEKKVLNCLYALEKQHIQDFEVIVVIDGSTDNTFAILNQKKFSFRSLKILNQENKGRSISRNNGAKAATGTILIFFDDDMRPEPDCIKVHLQNHAKFQNSIVIGPTLEDYKVLKTDVQLYKAYLSRKWLNPLNNQLEPLKKEQLYLSAANFSIPRNLFHQLDGFDENLTDAEDFDLGVRAFKKNISIYFEAKALAWHDDFITGKSYINRLQQYKAAHQKLKSLKPALYADFSQHQARPVEIYKKIIYKFFSQPFWINIIDNEVLKNVVPKKLRFKLYDYIFTSHIV